MDVNYKKIIEQAKAKKTINKKFLSKLNDKKIRDLDDVVQQANDRAFVEIDCLKCANCCKTTSPIFYDKDIERLAGYFKIKSAQFIDKYLHLDEVNDYVLNSNPCPFLGSDNYCSVYAHRPKACAEYPHTNRKNFYQLTTLTYHNTMICPAVNKVLDTLKSYYQSL